MIVLQAKALLIYIPTQAVLNYGKLCLHPSCYSFCPSDLSRAALVEIWYQGCCWRPEHEELLVLCLPSSGILMAGDTRWVALLTSPVMGVFRQ